MRKPDKEIEKELTSMLKECLEGINQEGGVKKTTYNSDDNTFTVVLDVVFEDDELLGFEGY
jgi:hypothetical protein